MTVCSILISVVAVVSVSISKIQDEQFMDPKNHASDRQTIGNWLNV